MTFYDGLLSLSIMSLRLIHVAAYVHILFLFVAGSYSLPQIILHLIYLFILAGHLSGSIF